MTYDPKTAARKLTANLNMVMPQTEAQRLVERALIQAYNAGLEMAAEHVVPGGDREAIRALITKPEEP
jgi:hypothetical protein